MIFKAFITDVPENGNNIFKVRVPFLEDNTTSEMIFNALLCNQPGLYYGYNVGDCVCVVFENDKIDTPIILGKLYVDVEDSSKVYQVVNELNVTGTVNLPDNTSIGGYSISNIFDIYQKFTHNTASDSTYDYEIIGQWGEGLGEWLALDFVNYSDTPVTQNPTNYNFSVLVKDTIEAGAYTYINVGNQW